MQNGFLRAAELIRSADSLLVTAGAGLGVDSGLPDFRGARGFWRAYPALGKARLRFEEIANPAMFRQAPQLAWGFYGHRLALYRRTQPGAPFGLLLRIARSLRGGAFVLTSNVDGHFQQAGFDPAMIVECHGSIHHLQCLAGCSDEIWEAGGFVPELDSETCTLRNQAPVCPRCGALARPNILMFGDWGWLDARTEAQWRRLEAWRRQVSQPVIIELGAGTAIATVRLYGERLAYPLIRINPDESEVPRASDVGLACTAAAGMQGIVDALHA